MKMAQKHAGFSLVELLLSLVILAVLTTAVAVAFDASVSNFRVNEGISKTTNAARAALLRMTTELRSARAVATIGVGTGTDADNTQCSLVTSDSRNIRYRHNAADQTLYLDTDGNSYVLCKNVAAATFNRAEIAGSNPRAIRNVRIVLTLTDDRGDNSQTFAAAAVVRRNLN